MLASISAARQDPQRRCGGSVLRQSGHDRRSQRHVSVEDAAYLSRLRGVTQINGKSSGKRLRPAAAQTATEHRDMDQRVTDPLLPHIEIGEEEMRGIGTRIAV